MYVCSKVRSGHEGTSSCEAREVNHSREECVSADGRNCFNGEWEKECRSSNEHGCLEQRVRKVRWSASGNSCLHSNKEDQDVCLEGKWQLLAVIYHHERV